MEVTKSAFDAAKSDLTDLRSVLDSLWNEGQAMEKLIQVIRTRLCQGQPQPYETLQWIRDSIDGFTGKGVVPKQELAPKAPDLKEIISFVRAALVCVQHGMTSAAKDNLTCLLGDVLGQPLPQEQPQLIGDRKVPADQLFNGSKEVPTTGSRHYDLPQIRSFVESALASVELKSWSAAKDTLRCLLDDILIDGSKEVAPADAPREYIKDIIRVVEWLAHKNAWTSMPEPIRQILSQWSERRT